MPPKISLLVHPSASLTSGANVAFNPDSNWPVIPQQHELLI